MASLAEGTWAPTLTLAYGIASASFLPLTRDEANVNRTTVDREQLNAHQVPLEVGDEVYVVEIFRPTQPVASSSASISADEGVWFRGYVVSSSPRPRLPTSTDIYSFPSSSSAPTLSEEPEVSLGIFPAVAVTIREHLAEDAERKLADLAAQADAQASGQLSRTPSRGPSRAGNGRMEPLQEEDEDEDPDDTFNIDGSTRRQDPVNIAPAGSPSKSRNRSSVGSLASFAQQLSSEQKSAFRASRLSYGAPTEDLRPPPPLPNLKCGDETLSGVEEPLVDEIACALREWASLLYTHLYRRDYALFESVKGHINALHTGRKQLLARTLSLEENEKLRRDVVARLVKGNIEQGLDVIVRHPGSGSLVDVGVEGEIDRKAWMSVVRMYAAQVALAHGAAMPETGLARQLPLVHTPNPNQGSPFMTHPSPDLNASSAPLDGSPAPAGAKFHHVFLDVRAVVANLAAPGEIVELYFSLFSKADARYVTEEFCVLVNHQGAPARESEGRFGRMRTVFRDLSQHDVSDQLYLVCRVVKNGAIKNSASISYSSSNTPPLGSRGGGFLAAPTNGRSETGSFDSSLSQTRTIDADSSGEGNVGMLFNDASGRPSYRRPFGCAVLEISQFNKRAGDEDVHPHDAFDSLGEHQMPIFVPVAEAAISTLHEDIINSRIKEIEKSPRAEHVAVSVRILHGEMDELVREAPHQLGDVPFTSRLGFPDVVFPGDTRNEVYLKLWSGEFGSSAGGGGGGNGTVRSLAQLAASAGGGANIEVTAELRTRDGVTVERVLSRGAGEPNVSQYSSMVFRSNSNPTWGELVKLAVAVETMEQSHLFFTFRNRISRSGIDVPFAFAYFPLFHDSSAFQTDGSHTLVLYKYDRQVAVPSFYFQVPSTYDASRQLAPLPPSVSRTLFPLKDSTMVLRSFLVSTTYTQNETLLRLLRWEAELLPDPELLKETLTKLRFCSEVEICKFLRDIFDALFGILVSPANQSGEMDDLVFQALVTIFGFVGDRRFQNFKPVLDLYISKHFTGSTAASHIIQALQRLLRTPTNPETATTLRSSIKVWRWLFKLVVRSREIQRNKGLGSGVTFETLEQSFKNDLSSLLSSVNSVMRMTTPPSIIGTQTLFVQNFASILPELATIFSQDELVNIAIAFVDSIGQAKGKMAAWRLLLLNQIVKSVLFASPTSRATLIPSLIRWLKPALGKFDENAMCSPKDPQTTRDNARVNWVEGIRLAVGVFAAILDSVHTALVDPDLAANRALLAQEHDNVEYLLALLPRLLESHRELADNLANLDAIERQRSPASMPATVPLVFPSTYPISLLSHPASHARRQATGRDARSSANADDKANWPTMRAGAGEVAAVFLTLVHLAPRKIFVNWLESTLEVEGKDTFGRQLGQVFRVSRAILENEAFDGDWLNISVLAHRIILKLAEPVADILVRDFIPPAQFSFKFNTSLWRDFFGMLLKLLASPQLLIEEFSPQKRRAVWRLAGDVRGEGAKILARTWNAVASPEERKPVRYGLYQVQFVPGLVEDVLSLCLSHHDELRRTAVQVLYSMIASEYALNKHFGIIEAEVIDRLDSLFGAQTKGDEISRAFFISQLRQLFDESEIDDALREQVDAFLASINAFLDLLLAVRNLPDGEEYQEDRITSTLKLMGWLQSIGRSEIFVRYVQKLVTYHAALGNETEAGLTLKLHADLHEWNLSTFVDPLPELDLPRQTEFARKETLYMRILEHLSKGKAWERALELCKELQHEYETRTFAYPRLAELLNLQAELYGSIAKSDRHFGNYFRVAFYGNRWPASVSGKQFIYRGHGLETLGAFIEKMLNKHPGAQLLKTSSIPSEEVQYGEGQFLQITAVLPEVDRSSPIFANPDTPHFVRAYYLANDVNTFSFSRPLTKDAEGNSRMSNDFASLWTEKTVLICEDSFPTVLRRSEIVEIRLIEISPVENALKDVEAKRTELSNLERRYRALSQTEADRRKINSNPLSMALNGAVDAPMNQGIPKYRQVFLQPEFIASLPPSQVGIVRQLETSIDELVITLAKCLRLHSELCPPEMQPFHDTLERFFEKNFAEELARLPEQAYEPAGFGNASSASSVMDGAAGQLPAGPRQFGSLLITSASSTSLPPSASSTSFGLPSHGRRESVTSHAVNDQSLVAGPSRIARQGSTTAVPSGLTGAASGRPSSVYSNSTAQDGRHSPTRSLFSIRSSTAAGHVNGPSAPNGADANGGAPGGVGRRASLFLSSAASGVKKLGRRKGSVATTTATVMEE
ncbi:hypothetical protein JCM10207_002794 [Rhodosporidiobolus poonsookiae]